MFNRHFQCTVWYHFTACSTAETEKHKNRFVNSLIKFHCCVYVGLCRVTIVYRHTICTHMQIVTNLIYIHRNMEKINTGLNLSWLYDLATLLFKSDFDQNGKSLECGCTSNWRIVTVVRKIMEIPVTFHVTFHVKFWN